MDIRALVIVVWIISFIVSIISLRNQKKYILGTFVIVIGMLPILFAVGNIFWQSFMNSLFNK